MYMCTTPPQTNTDILPDNIKMSTLFYFNHPIMTLLGILCLDIFTNYLPETTGCGKLSVSALF